MRSASLLIAAAVVALTIYALAMDPFSFLYALLAAWMFSLAAIVRCSVGRRSRAQQVRGALAGIGFAVLVSLVAYLPVVQHSRVGADALLILVTALGVGLIVVPNHGAFVTVTNRWFVYLRSLGSGLAAAAAVIYVGWIVGLGPRESISWVLKIPSASQAVRAGYRPPVTTPWICEGVVDLIPPPWYVTGLAGLALVTPSAWQLRRSWRARG